jgi:phosphoenolpyruvate carboxykinase (ATP)
MSEILREVPGAIIINNPDGQTMRSMAAKDERTTVYGSPSYLTLVRSRSAKKTYVVEGNYQIGAHQQSITQAEAGRLAEEVQGYLKGKEVVRLDRRIGETAPWKYHCRLYITKDFARIPLMWEKTLFPADDVDANPDFVSIFVPEWPERVIFVEPEAGICYILGTDYFGECKKSFLRMAMYRAKVNGGLGLHAGSKIIRVRGLGGGVQNVGFIMFGLSGTGKTTLTIHDHGLDDPEGVNIRQDDVVIMDASGACFGTENGFFIKTEGLDESQRVLFKAATSPNAALENVLVAEDGSIDFSDVALTANGRGVILRAETELTDDTIDIPRADRVIFITRRKDIVPAVARLNPAQAAASFMLGESIETSAGDPTKAGQSKREVGTNPFIIGPEEEEGNRIYEIFKTNPEMECYLLNTGSVGFSDNFNGEKVTIKATTEIMKQLAKGGIRWQLDADWGYEVPVEMPGVDIGKYNPVRYYSDAEYLARVAKLRSERRQWLDQFPGLHQDIKHALFPGE